MTDLQGKSVLITGGAQGIGKALSLACLKAGLFVTAADVDEEAGQDLCAGAGHPQALEFIKADVSLESDCEAMVKAAVSRFQRLDFLINNAGIAHPPQIPFEHLTLQDWNRVLSVNLTGAFLASRAAVPLIRRQKGAILHISSTRALQSEPHWEAYAASKGGILSLTHAMALSLGPEIRVNCILPGWIETRNYQKQSRAQNPDLSPEDHAQHPAGRVGVPDDVASLALFLLSGQSGFITGAHFVCDGGMTRKMIYF